MKLLRDDSFQFRKLMDNRSGSILPIIAIVLVVIIVIAGAGVDYARAINRRGKLAHAIDAAALTLAAKLSSSVMTDAEVETALRNSISANFNDPEYLDAVLTNLDFTVDSDKGTIAVLSELSVPTKFISLRGIGPETLTVTATTEVNYSRFDVELALVLDVTGSMRRDIHTLKTAAGDLIDTLIPEGTPPSDSKVRISVIPYSQGVNLGEYAKTVSNGDAGNRNCVTERVGDAQYTDDTYDYDKKNSASYFGGGSNSCAATPQMEPLTAKRNKLTSAISKLSASGGTAGQTGIAWGWYSLSPNWTDLWPANSDPARYDDDEILKFAVIMTDGDNNRYYDRDQRHYGWYWHNGWHRGWYTIDGWSEVGENESYNNISSTRSRALCEAMKDKGISVYGIYFGNKTNSAGAKNMSSCATDSSTFYQAKSADDLINAFGNIAKKIQAIYLAK